MADANSSPAASGNAQQPPQQQRQPQNGSFIQQILQYVMMYLLITNIFTFFKPKSSTSSNSDLTNINEDFNKIPRIEKPTEFQTALMGVNPNANLPVFPTRDSEGRKLGNHKCLFTKGILLDFYLFITDDKYFNYVEDIDKLVRISFFSSTSIVSHGSRSGILKIFLLILHLHKIQSKISILLSQLIC